jgi:hypothetical protein
LFARGEQAINVADGGEGRACVFAQIDDGGVGGHKVSAFVRLKVLALNFSK